MGKLLDAIGAVGSQFQIGIGGTGLRRLRFKNGFSGDLEFNPTANRTVKLPDTGGFVQVMSGETLESGTKPTTRRDGSSLVTGDRWLDTTDRIWWYWNGTYWLSEQLHWFDAAYPLTLTASSFPGGFNTSSSYNLYLLDFTFSARFVAGTYDSSNYWRARLIRDVEGTGVSGTQVAAFSTLQSTIAADEIRAYSLAVNQHLDVSVLSINRLRLDIVKNGSAPTITGAGSRLTYRLAKP